VRATQWGRHSERDAEREVEELNERVRAGWAREAERDARARLSALRSRLSKAREGRRNFIRKTNAENGL
jgi:hypothetical protein